MSDPQVYKFSIGQRVKVESGFGQVSEGVVTKRESNMYGQAPLYEIEFMEPDRKYKTWTSESYISEVNPPPLPIGNSCTCGLKFTREGGKHSDWCNLYCKEDKT